MLTATSTHPQSSSETGGSLVVCSACSGMVSYVACSGTQEHAIQVMATQISHAKLPGPGGLQASVFLVTNKQGGTWHTVLKPGFLVMNQTPAVLYLQHCQPSFASQGGDSTDTGGSNFAIAQVRMFGSSRDASLLAGPVMLRVHLQATVSQWIFLLCYGCTLCLPCDYSFLICSNAAIRSYHLT